MSDYSELERLAEAAPTGPWITENDSLYFKDDGYTRHLLDADAGHDVEEEAYCAALNFIAAANPDAVLALIAENKTLNAQVETFQSDANSWQSGYDEGRRMGTKHMYAEVDRLKAELDCPFRLARHSKRLVEQLRAEVAGLKTGYEAYERVNAELKAECEALRQLTVELRGSAECHNVHHCRAEEHEFGDPCKVLARIDAAMGKGDRP